MTLPASGAISFNAINVELGVTGTTQANINQATYRTLAGVPSGQISLSDFYGKSNEFAFTISSNQTNANLRTLAVAAGWPGTAKVVATINGGVYVSSNSTGTPGLTVNGSFPGGVSLINNGFIIGMGGAGGSIQNVGIGPADTGKPGGLALSVSVALTVTNNGTIGGGGGGGGPGGVGATSVGCCSFFGFGGGGGGGRTGSTNSAAGVGGPTGKVGTSSAAGGSTAGSVSGPASGGTGGAGGDWGSSGTGGTNGSPSYPPAGGAGGAGGGAITGNSNITYVTTGTRLGSIT